MRDPSWRSRRKRRPLHRRIAYLCLQVTREGQASHAHVNEIVGNLRSIGWKVEIFEPRIPDVSWRVIVVLAKLLEFVRIQLSLVVRLRRFRLLYVRLHPAALPACLSARLLGVPVVVEVNGTHADVLLAYPLLRLLPGVVRASMLGSLTLGTAVVTVTDELRSWVHEEVGPCMARVIPNGANTSLFRPVMTRCSDYVVFFGALAPWQGVDVMLAATRSRQWPSGVRLVILGDGDSRTQVEAAARKSSLIDYRGRVPYGAVGRIVASSLAGLSPQTNEGRSGPAGLNPLKVFETLACGVPAIVSDFPGQADLVRDHRCGLVIPGGSGDALARAVRHLWRHPGERTAMGRRGRAAVVRAHSWRARAMATSDLLLDVIRGEGQA